MILFPQQVRSLANYDMAVSRDDKSGNDVTGTTGVAMGMGVGGVGGGGGRRGVGERGGGTAGFKSLVRKAGEK